MESDTLMAGGLANVYIYIYIYIFVQQISNYICASHTGRMENQEHLFPFEYPEHVLQHVRFLSSTQMEAAATPFVSF